MNNATNWVSVWGNAVSVAENRPERYAKNITIRYPIHIPFAGTAVRLTFDNYCGTEPITLNKTTVFYGGKFYPVSFGGSRSVTIGPGARTVSDALPVTLTEGEIIQVSFYLADFTLMRSVVYTCGPLSEGLYANGDETENAHIDLETSRKTHLQCFRADLPGEPGHCLLRRFHHRPGLAGSPGAALLPGGLWQHRHYPPGHLRLPDPAGIHLPDL